MTTPIASRCLFLLCLVALLAQPIGAVAQKKKGKGANAIQKILNEKYPEVEGRWSAEKANEWYAELPWLVGCNFYPSTAINQIDMWQASTFDPETIDKELGWAAELGMNTLRVYLHDLVWDEDAEGFYKRIDQFLELCAAHEIRPFFVFFDDCHFPNPKMGPQPLPVKAYHNSGWVNSPSRDLAIRFANGDASEEEVARLKGYVQETIKRFRDDERVLLWELYNEPGRGNSDGAPMEGLPEDGAGKIGELSNRLVYQSWVWAREVAPTQPIISNTAGSVGNVNIAINRSNSDLHSIHSYSPPDKFEETILDYLEDGRPVIVTEWLARDRGNTVADCLPIMKKHRVGAVNWGFVSGESGTVWPWSSRTDRVASEERQSGNVVNLGEPFPEPEIWFHDLLRQDGTPYDPAEVKLFKKLTEE